jgi:hypothetical protein
MGSKIYVRPYQVHHASSGEFTKLLVFGLEDLEQFTIVIGIFGRNFSLQKCIILNKIFN